MTRLARQELADFKEQVADIEKQSMEEKIARKWINCAKSKNVKREESSTTESSSSTHSGNQAYSRR